MRIVIAIHEDNESQQLAQLLKSLGHECVRANEATLSRELAEHKSHAVLLGAQAQPTVFLSMVRAAQQAPSHPHVMLLHSGMEDGLLTQAFEAGVDVELRRPLSAKGFAARVAAVQRRTVDAPVAHASRPPAGPLETVAHGNTWASVLEHVQEGATRFLTMPVTRAALPADFVLAGIGTTIVLLNASTQTELRISVGMDVSSAESLAMHLFGAADAELGQEVLNELSNIFMGALKTALSAEGHAYTSGLPQPTSAEAVLRPPSPCRFQETALFAAGDARFVVFVGLRSRANLQVQVQHMKEGMVLARDLLNPRGILLLNGGTRVSENMVERLRANLPPKMEVEVIAP